MNRRYWMIQRFAMIRICCAALLFVLACNRTPTEERARLTITVRDPSGQPVPDATVQVDGKTAGQSNGDGVTETWVVGREGRRIHTKASCPDGYRADKNATETVTLRLLRPVGDKAGATVPLRSDLICTPTSQLFVLVVKTDRSEEIPIVASGRVATRTDSDGAAQTVLGGTIGEELEVVLDTSDYPDLLPQSPSRRLVIPESPRILVFDQEFKTKKKPVRKRRHIQLGPKRI